MPYFLAGLALLVLLIFAARLFAKANPRLLAERNAQTERDHRDLPRPGF